jgi:hypothetical protein
MLLKPASILLTIYLLPLEHFKEALRRGLSAQLSTALTLLEVLHDIPIASKFQTAINRSLDCGH